MSHSLPKPDSYNLATRALIAGTLAEAETLINDLLNSAPGDARAWLLKSRLAAERGDFLAEMRNIEEAVRLAPDRGEYLAQLGKSFARRQDITAAIQCADKAEALADSDDVTLDAVASIHTRFGHHNRAAEILTRAAATSRNPAVHFNLGTSCKFCGDFERARTAYETAIKLAPYYHKAHAALTSLGGITAENHHLDRLLPLIARTPDVAEHIHLSHAAAKECEALENYDQAFTLLGEAKSALRDRLGYNFDEDKRLFDSLHEAFAVKRAVKGYSGVSPVFIVGMPRSGTTLLDRVISGHPNITSIGETQHFTNLLKATTRSNSRHVFDIATVSTLSQLTDLSAMGRAYMERGLTATGDSRFLDKFHINILAAGFIARALPDARILCVIRNPLDTIISNFRQLFEFSSPVYRYTLDLVSTAQFYIEFRRLTDLWQSLFPDQFHVVNYEELVRHPQSTIRKILDVVGLPWDERCLHIEDNTAPVATASAVQVRQPINARSVGSWRRYDAYLDDVKALLTSANLQFDAE